MHAYLRSFIRSLMSIACIHMQIFYEHWARPIHPDWAVKHRLIAICLHYHLTVGTWHRNCWLCLWEPRCFWETKMSFWKKEAAVCQGVTLSTLTFPLLLFEFFPAFWRIQTHGESVKAVQKLRCSLTAYSPHPPVIERSAHVMFVFQGNHWSILVHEFLGTQIFQDLGSWRLLKDINLWDLKERRGIAVCKTPGTGKAVVAFRQFHLERLGQRRCEQLCDVWCGNHSNQSCSCFREIRSEDVQKPSGLEYYDPSPLPCVNGLI